jgi:hypothetical protein
VAREDRRGLRRHGLRERHPRRRGLGAADADFLVDAYALDHALEVTAAGDVELHGGQRAGCGGGQVSRGRFSFRAAGPLPEVCDELLPAASRPA